MATIRRRSGGYNVQIYKQGYSIITKSFSSITTAHKSAADVEADMEPCVIPPSSLESSSTPLATVSPSTSGLMH